MRESNGSVSFVRGLRSLSRDVGERKTSLVDGAEVPNSRRTRNCPFSRRTRGEDGGDDFRSLVGDVFGRAATRRKMPKAGCDGADPYAGRGGAPSGLARNYADWRTSSVAREIFKNYKYAYSHVTLYIGC